VDLAWGNHNRTGLCTLDESGQSVDSGRADSHEHLAEWVRPHLSDGYVIAVDARPIVKHCQGRRPCEDLVSRALGHRDAAAYSSNPSYAMVH
jgi:predicted RNase H-like nuclease